MRIIRNQTFDTSKYIDENFLYSNKLVDIPTISKHITYLYGRDNDMFPLSFLTEGQGNVTKKTFKSKDTQYTWGVMGHMTFINKVVRISNPAMTEPGRAFTYFKAIFETDIFPKNFGAVSPDHKHLVFITGEPNRLGDKEFEYEFQIVGANNEEAVGLGNFAAGSAWVMSTPTVPMSKSTGNRTNRTLPGKMTNQLSLHRHTLNIAGNAANKATIYEFKKKGGGTTNLWIPEEMNQFDFQRRVLDEDNHWYSVYNRDSNGNITTIDRDTKQPVPRGAGVKQFIQSANNHQYYTRMTLDLLEGMINKIHSNRTDGGVAEVVIYGGAGAKREFQRAIKDVAVNSQYYNELGAQEIQDLGLSMKFGKYFTAFKTIDGKVITFVEMGLFNKGPRAQQDTANGRTVDGFPVESYNMVFLDHGIDMESGEPNVQMVKEEGRELLTGVYKGLTPLPPEWGSVYSDLLSTDRDEASYEMMYSSGIAIKNATTSFWFELDYTDR